MVKTNNKSIAGSGRWYRVIFYDSIILSTKIKETVAVDVIREYTSRITDKPAWLCEAARFGHSSRHIIHFDLSLGSLNGEISRSRDNDRDIVPTS